MGDSVSLDGSIAVGVNMMATVSVAIESDTGVSVVPGVAVITMISGEGQAH